MAESIKFDVFFDYNCPYVYRAAGLIDGVRRAGRDVEVRWRYFSLTQVNSNNDGWTVWGAAATEKVRGRLAFQAAEAARRQGRFEALHVPLLAARHRDKQDLDDASVVAAVAEAAGLDMRRFHQDIADPGILDALARDHVEAVRVHGVFGTPTFLFEDGASAYVRLSERIESDGAAAVFDRLLAVAATEPRILEIKRPKRPIQE